MKRQSIPVFEPFEENGEDSLLECMKKYAIELSERFMRNIKIELNVDYSQKLVKLSVEVHNI